MKVTEILNNFAISSDGIATALQDSASSLMAANNSYEEAVALIASANRVVQDPNSVGAALRTISLRLRGTSVEELEEAGEDTAGAITSKSKLQGKIKSLAGVDILTDTGAYKSTYDILLDISKVWEDMSDINQAALLEILAGKTRSNTAAAILSNTKDLKEAYAQAMEAEGSALEENEKYLDSIQGRIDLFNNSVQTMWSNTLDSSIVKGIVNIVTGLVKIVDQLGLVKTLVFAIGTYLVQKHFKGDLWGGLFGAQDVSVDDIKKKFKDLKTAYSQAIDEFNKSPTEENKQARDNAKKNLDDYTSEHQSIIDADNKKTALNEQLEKLKLEKQQLQSDIKSLQQQNDAESARRQKETKKQSIVDKTNQLSEIDKLDAEIAEYEKQWDLAREKVRKSPSKRNKNKSKELRRKLTVLDEQKKALLGADGQSVDSQIEEHDKLSETLKEQGDNAENTQESINSLNETLKDKEVLTETDIAQQEELKNKLADVDTEIAKTEQELKKVEIQSQSTGQAGLSAGQKIKAGFKAAWTSVKQFGVEIIKSMAWSAAITAVLESLTIIGGWLGDIVNALRPKTFEDFQEALEQTENELSNVESEVRSLESELDDANERIEELIDQGTLTFVEQEELNNLKAVTKELESQIALKKTLQKTLQQQANDQAIEANDAYLDTSFMSDQTRTEKQEKWGETGEDIGKVVGTSIGVAFGAKAMAAIGAKIGTVIAPGLGTAIGVAAGAIIGGVVGKFVGEGAAGVAYDSEQTVGEAMDNMIVEREKLLAKQQKALADEDVESYNEATEALRTYDNQMAKHISQIQENYNAMDWETATDEQKKQMIEYADWLSKYSINMGTEGAKSATIERLFGAEASEDVKRLKQNIEEAIETSRQNGEDLDFDFQGAFNDDDLVEFKQRLYDIGLTVVDVEYYFRDLAKAEKEAENSYTTYDTVKQINSLSDGVNSLKDAFGQLQEQGYVSTETLVSLQETFGGLGDSWTNFVDTVATGTGSIKEATEAINELLEAYLTEQLAQGPMGAEETLKTIMLLQQLGVKNAKEYVDAMQKASAVQNVANSYVSDQKRIEELEAKKKKNGGKGRTEKEIEEQESLETKTKDINNYIKEIEETYKIDLSPDEERLLIEKAITAEKQKQYAEELKAQQTAYDTAVYEKAAAEDKNKEIQKRIDRLSDVNDSQQYTGVSEGDEKILAKYGVTENEGTSASGMGSNITYKYNGKSYTSLDAVKKAVKKDLEAQKVEVPKVPAEVTEVDVQNAEEAAESGRNDLENAFNDLGLALDVEVITPSDLVDQVQSVYDTLMDAATEYNKNGYFSVDTLQSLLDLEPKYLTMLMNEQGQLDLNTQAVLNVAQARLFDMTQKQIDSIITNASNAAKDGEISKLKELTDTLYEAANARNEFNIAGMATLRQNLANSELGLSEAEQEGYYNKVQAQIDAAIAAYNQTVSNLPKALSSSGSSDDATNGALEAIQKKYERQIKNLDNQQTYIQNEIDRLEAEDQAVSKSYYEQQIDLEEQKLDLYEQEREALLKLDMTDEVADALWEVEHAIQESTMRMVEFRKSIVALYKAAFDDAVGAYNDKDELLSDRQEYIEKYRELLELQNSPETASGYQEQIDLETERMQDNIAELALLESALASGVASGYLEEGSEEWVEMQATIRETEAAILDNKIAIEQFSKELKNIPVEAFNSVRDAFSFQDEFLSNQQEYIEGYADYLEALGIDVPQELYDELIAIEEEKRANNITNLVDARQGLADIEAAGYTVADEEWQDAYNQVVALEKAVQDNDIAMANYAKTIRELDFEKFERFISRFDDLESELEHLRGLFDDEDVAFEDGTWTKEGITSLGLLYQQMQLNQAKAQEYAQEIEELNDEYDQGSMSEQEYYEKHQQLVSGQWDAIEASEDAKDAIIDLEEARIDMIEKGIEEEISAMEELISLKQEELEAERD